MKEQQTRLTEGGKKRKRPRDGGKRHKGQEGCQGGVKKHLDALSVGYFRRVSERLSEGFALEEEKGKGGVMKLWARDSKQ